jgi:hypothetical protein
MVEALRGHKIHFQSHCGLRGPGTKEGSILGGTAAGVRHGGVTCEFLQWLESLEEA